MNEYSLAKVQYIYILPFTAVAVIIGQQHFLRICTLHIRFRAVLFSVP